MQIVNFYKSNSYNQILNLRNLVRNTSHRQEVLSFYDTEDRMPVRGYIRWPCWDLTSKLTICDAECQAGTDQAEGRSRPLFVGRVSTCYCWSAELLLPDCSPEPQTRTKHIGWQSNPIIWMLFLFIAITLVYLYAAERCFFHCIKYLSTEKTI